MHSRWWVWPTAGPRPTKSFHLLQQWPRGAPGRKALLSLTHTLSLLELPPPATQDTPLHQGHDRRPQALQGGVSFPLARLHHLPHGRSQLRPNNPFH